METHLECIVRRESCALPDLTREAHVSNFEKFINTDCYKATRIGTAYWMWLWPIAQYEVTAFGFGWEAPDGDILRSVPKFRSDEVSTPPFIWCIPGYSPNRFEFSGLMHDSECGYGGVFRKKPQEKEFHFVRTTRSIADDHLRIWVGAEGGNAFERETYHGGVRLGAVFQKFPSEKYWDDGGDSVIQI